MVLIAVHVVVLALCFLISWPLRPSADGSAATAFAVDDEEPWQGHSERPRGSNSKHVNSSDCEAWPICFVTSNQPQQHGVTGEQVLGALFEGCMSANNSTRAVILSLQDLQLEALPDVVKVGSLAFTLERKHVYGPNIGTGHLCLSRLADGGAIGSVLGALVVLLAVLNLKNLSGKGVFPITVKVVAAFAGAALMGIVGHLISESLGMNCGGLALTVYTRDMSDGSTILLPEEPGTRGVVVPAGLLSATNYKGTVVALLNFKGRSLLIASTHAHEGVRGKHHGSSCSREGDATGGKEHEHQRVREFRAALKSISSLRQDAELLNSGDPPAVMWGGDFNPRSVHPDSGCPIWPPEVAGVKDGHKQQTDANASLSLLSQGREFIGEDPDITNFTLATFRTEVRDEDLQEVPGLLCPTYKKISAPSSADTKSIEDHFQCFEEGHGWMHYKPSHPPSWTDRIFVSRLAITSDKDSRKSEKIADVSAPPAWLRCGPARRIAHDSDHDAVFVLCTIAPSSDTQQSCTS